MRERRSVRNMTDEQVEDAALGLMVGDALIDTAIPPVDAHLCQHIFPTLFNQSRAAIRDLIGSGIGRGTYVLGWKKDIVPGKILHGKTQSYNVYRKQTLISSADMARINAKFRKVKRLYYRAILMNGIIWDCPWHKQLGYVGLSLWRRISGGKPLFEEMWHELILRERENKHGQEKQNG